MRREFEKIKAEYEQNWRDQKEFDDERRDLKKLQLSTNRINAIKRKFDEERREREYEKKN